MAEFPALPLFTDAYLADTRHLTAAQHGAYLLLLMMAWRQPDCSLPDDDMVLCRWASMDLRTWQRNKSAIMTFWKLGLNAKWQQSRLVDERQYVTEVRIKKSAAGKISALKRNNRHSTPVEQHVNITPAPTPIPTPIKEESKSRGTRFALADPPADWIQFCQTQRPDLDAGKLFDGFRDHWIAKAGKDGIKLDWFATWRNWVRREKSPTKGERYGQPNKADRAKAAILEGLRQHEASLSHPA